MTVTLDVNRNAGIFYLTPETLTFPLIFQVEIGPSAVHLNLLVEADIV